MFGMRRREFITLLGGASAWPLAAGAQQPAMPVIGLLSSRSIEDSRQFVVAFRQGLNQAGFFEDRHVAIEYHSADDRYDLMPALAAELGQERDIAHSSARTGRRNGCRSRAASFVQCAESWFRTLIASRQ